MSLRAIRRHHAQRVAANRRPYATRQQSDNELAVRHPLDCGSRCFLCHGEKLVGAGRRRAREAREWMREFVTDKENT